MYRQNTGLIPVKWPINLDFYHRVSACDHPAVLADHPVLPGIRAETTAEHAEPSKHRFHLKKHVFFCIKI